MMISCKYLKTKALQNLTISVTPMKRVDFSEVTGGRALSFSNLSMGETAATSFSEENAEGVRNPP